MKEKPKRLVLCTLPTNKCNLKCRYCYISQMKDWDKSVIDFKYSVDTIIKGLSRERLGGTCIINLTGEGETLLQPNIVEVVKGLLGEGHYVEIVTNGTIKRIIQKILCFPEECLKRLEFKISFHYDELKQLGILDNFWSNVDLIRSSPCSFSIELMPHDRIENEIVDIIEMCRNKAGANCHLTIGRRDNALNRGILTEHNKNEYFKIWEVFGSKMFEFKMELVNVKRREFCYAGEWSLFVNLATGETKQCYGQPIIQNIFEDIKKPIKFVPVGYYCMQPFCINGHALLTWGCIPELDTPTYCEMRNREGNAGSWLKNEWHDFSRHKLIESNCEYTIRKKIIKTMGYPFTLIRSYIYNPQNIYKNIKRFYKKITNANK